MADVGKVLLTLVGAVIIGGAIPAARVAFGGLLQSLWGGSSGTSFVSILTIFAGILATYYAMVWAAGRIAVWGMPQGAQAAPRRYSWNRSMRDERKRPPRLSMLETVFVWTAILATGAYLVWFLFFAGSPPPSA